MAELTRRDLLWLGGLAALPLASACAGAGSGRRAGSWSTEERIRLDERREDFELITRGSEHAAVLRRRAREVPAELDTSAIARRMQAAMRKAEGVGIAGPQVGLSLRVAVLMLDYKTDQPRTVFVRNPLIVERSDETLEGYEGCLSVPEVGGLVRRNRWVKVEYQDPAGKLHHAEAEGPNAVLWQHELDHLDGGLYLDRLLGELLPMDEVRRLRKQAEQPPPTPDPPALDVSRLPADHLEGSLWLV